MPETTTTTPATAPAPTAAPSPAPTSDAQAGGPPTLASLAARAAGRADAPTAAPADAGAPAEGDAATELVDVPAPAPALDAAAVGADAQDAGDVVELPAEAQDPGADLVRSVVDAVLAKMDERLRPLHERLDAMSRAEQPGRAQRPRAAKSRAPEQAAPARRAAAAPQPAQAQAEQPVQPDQSRRQRALDDPYFAQAMLRLGGEALPDFILDDAAVNLQNRSYYATRITDEVEGPKAREQIARIDRNLARLEYEARRYEREQLALRPAAPDDDGEQPEPAAAIPLDARVQYGRRIADAMRRGGEDVAFLSHLSPEAVIALAVETEADSEEAFFGALVEAAEKRRPTAAAPAPAGKRPPAPAAAPARPAAPAQPAAAPQPQNGALRVRNPASVGAVSDGATVGPRWPTDRPPTLNEVSSRVNARPN